MTGSEDRVYELGKSLGNLHDIEGAIERFRRQALPDLTAELLVEAQTAQSKDLKKGATGFCVGKNVFSSQRIKEAKVQRQFW